MPRRRVVAKREILPDPKFGSEIISKFVNHVMIDGKKSIAEKVVYGAFEVAYEKSKQVTAVQLGDDKPIPDFDRRSRDNDEDEGGSGSIELSANAQHPIVDMFVAALANIRPLVEVKSRRVGGSTYQVPIEVRPARQTALAMRWLVDCAKKRSEKNMLLRLGAEIVDAIQGKGGAVRKREEMHRMAKANQAFAHYRW